MKRACYLATLLFCFLGGYAQKANWQNLDLEQDTVFGISAEKAYRELLSKKKKFKPVIVGVIDSGIDTAHEDLQSVIWTNPKETAGNGIDDDKDGYVDDLHGWNFIGGPKGNVNQETLELTRLIRKGEGNAAMQLEYDKQVQKDRELVSNYTRFASDLDSIVPKMGSLNPTLADVQSFVAADSREQRVKEILTGVLQDNPDYQAFRNDRLVNAIKHFQDDLDYHMNPNFNPRPIVGDDSSNVQERFYGNSNVEGPAALHGTHVAGIIAAVRNNHIGINGIADHARIMSVRTVPDGDERDKDVANAIRFATDHGAKVLNMSFGKAYSPDKKVVDEAVRYAMSKDVLLVHAAGNEGKNLDHSHNYPNRLYQDSTGSAEAWIEVGASGWINDSTLVASFSNYGKNSVDVFAPGLYIHSSIPGSKYADESGTSMASPVVAGLATLIREYYPKLTAVQVKQIILQSVVKPAQQVLVKDDGAPLRLPFSEICVSGGVVNAYNALKLAASF